MGSNEATKYTGQGKQLQQTAVNSSARGPTMVSRWTHEYVVFTDKCEDHTLNGGYDQRADLLLPWLCRRVMSHAEPASLLEDAVGSDTGRAARVVRVCLFGPGLLMTAPTKWFKWGWARQGWGLVPCPKVIVCQNLISGWAGSARMSAAWHSLPSHFPKDKDRGLNKGIRHSKHTDGNIGNNFLRIVCHRIVMSHFAANSNFFWLRLDNYTTSNVKKILRNKP